MEPPSVVHATQEYREEEDVIGRFLADCCRFGPGLRAGSRALTAALEKWSEEEGIKPALTSKALASSLRQRGFGSPRRSNGQSWWEGVAVTDHAD